MEMIVRTIKTGCEPCIVDKVYRYNQEAGAFEPEVPEVLRQFKDSFSEVIFLTGNKNKLAEMRKNLFLSEGVKLSCPQEKINLAEIQDGEIFNIVQDKCQRACEYLNRGRECEPLDQENGNDSKRVILVEDTCLNFEALNGMPGPYVKWFLEAIGPEGLFRMLMGFPNKSAEAVCIYALMNLDVQNQSSQHDEHDSSFPTVKEKTILFFRGFARGQIVEPRRGSPTMGWGWDPIFEEERSQLTFAEMEPELKSKFSHRANALKILQAFMKI